MKKIFLLVLSILSILCFASCKKNNVKSDDTNNMVTSEKKGQIYLQSGVGQTIDVVTAANYNNYKTGVSVLDFDKLNNSDYLKKDNKSSNVSNNSYKSIEEVYDKGSISFALSVDKQSNKKVFGFVKNYNVNFKASTTIEYKDVKDSFYFTLDHYVNRYTLSLFEYLEKEKYNSYLSESYLDALNNLGSNPSLKDFYELFDKYGTHLIASGIFGGRLDAYYTVVNKTSKFSNDTRLFLSTTLSKAATKKNVTTIDTTTEIQNYFESNSHTIETNFKMSNQGGDSVGAVNLDDFGDAYEKWLDSFNTDSSNSVLIGFEEDGLIPLWELLPSKYSILKESMEEAFLNYYEDYYKGYIKEFSYNNTIDYAGGSGTPYDPYLIKNANHLANIELNLDACFEIIDDIDLSGYSNWKAIGGHYKDDSKMFRGVLEGNNHVISNLTRTSDIQEKGSRIYYGLFGRIGEEGIVRNISFENVNVNVTGPEVNDSNARVFFGVVTGALYGKVSNVTINSGSYKYNCCTNGTVFVGSIAGTSVNCTIENCVNNIDLVSGRYAGVVGGMTGFAANVKFNNCTNNGKLKAYRTSFGGISYSGGMVGSENKTRECTYYLCVNNGILDTAPYSGSGGDHSTGDLSAHKTDSMYE